MNTVDMSKWKILATRGTDLMLIDTGEPNPDIKGDTMARLYDVSEHLVSIPLSAGKILKQGYWDYCDQEEVPRAFAILKGAKEVSDPQWEKLTGVVL